MALHLSEVLPSFLGGQGWLGSRALAQPGWQEGCKLLCTSGQGCRWKHGLLCSLWGHCLPVFYLRVTEREDLLRGLAPHAGTGAENISKHQMPSGLEMIGM